MRFMFGATLMVCGLAAFAPPSVGSPWEPGTTVFEYRESSEDGPDRSLDSTIIGSPATHVVKFKDTLLDIARLNHLGYQELKQANPGVDPWLPERRHAGHRPSPSGFFPRPHARDWC